MSEAGVKQASPAICEIRKKVFLMMQQLVQTSIEFVFGDGCRIFSQQIPHGALPVPMPMQCPFTAGGNQPVAGQGFQNVEPVGFLATRRESGNPERVEIQQIPQLARQPTGTPLSGTMKFQRTQSDLNDFTVQLR